MTTAKYSDLVLYQRVLHQARASWPQLGGILLLSLLWPAIALLYPLPLKIVVDSVLGSHPIPAFLDKLVPRLGDTGSHTALLVLAVTLLVATVLLSQLQLIGMLLLSTYVGEKLTLEFRAQLFRQAQRLSLSYYHSQGKADSVYRIQNDALSVKRITIDGIIPMMTKSVMLVSIIFVIARFDWQLALVVVAVSPALFIFSRTYAPKLRRQSHGLKEAESSSLAVVQQTLDAINVVKSFGQEDREQTRFVRRSSRSVRESLSLARTARQLSFLVMITSALAQAAVLFIGARHVQSGVLTLGELLMVWAYLTRLYEPLKTISRAMQDLQSWLASAERAFALLDELPEVPERPNARPLARASGDVIFRNVSFAYDQDHPVLSEISFDIPAGSRVGIAGMTGAGKTTLVSLMNRFYDPTGGQILLDGLDLRDYRLVDLRNQFAIVPQEPVLLSTTIAENIAYARPSASESEIVEAAKAAAAHEFITRLPEGYQAQAGERGALLSVGERQRISLARAFLKAAPILILDEPTSSVDAGTEAEIVDALDRLAHNRTVFIISHRLSTLKNCDMILALGDGRLAPQASASSPSPA